MLRSAYRHELETRLSHKPWTQEISKVTDWPRRKAVAEFWLCVGHDCLGTHLHCIGIHPDAYCTVVSRGSWRLTGHQLYSPLDHVYAFLLVGLVCLQRWERKVSVTWVVLVCCLEGDDCRGAVRYGAVECNWARSQKERRYVRDQRPTTGQ